MELKLKDNYQEAYVFVPFVNANVMGKFIEEGLYPHLYKISPEMFDVIEESFYYDIPVKEVKKTKKVDDIFINISTDEGDTTSK